MHNTSKEKEFQAEWGIALAALAVTLGFQANGMFQPSFTLHAPFLAVILPLFGSCALLSLPVILFMAIRYRRPMKGVIAFAGICVGTLMLTTGSARIERAWGKRFSEVRIPMETMINHVHSSASRSHPAKLPLPSSFVDHRLTFDGNLHTYTDNEGKVWFLFLQYLHMVDNGFGFAWSKEGRPPPRAAFYEITKTKPLGDGWYMFWST